MNSRSQFKQLVQFVFLFILPLKLLAFSSTSDVIGGLPLSDNINVSQYAPVNTNNVPEVLISRDVYLLSINPQKRLLNWAAWKIEASDMGTVGRSNKFNQDPDLETYLSARDQHAVQKDDYLGSCFDRGHQVPSADRTTTLPLNELTFLMSNMIPQTAFLNRGMWAHLEHYSRELVRSEGKKVYIISGPIYDEDFGAIGKNGDIPVPSKNFKILIYVNKDQDINDQNVKPDIIAVVMPNILRTGEKPHLNKEELCKESSFGPGAPNSGDTTAATPVNQDDWKQYQVSPAEVERLSGFKISHITGPAGE